MKNILLIFAVFFMLTGVLMAQYKDLGIPKFLDPVQAPAVGYPGVVRVRVEVDAAGSISNAVLLSGPRPVCKSITRPDVVASRERAVELVHEMKFKPGKNDGKPSPMAYVVPIDFTASESAQNNAVNFQSLSVDYLNRNALSLPAPTTPPAARVVRASGTVEIYVLIDEDGFVFSAEARSGHPLLQAAAETAACEARFKPTLLDEKPVKANGILTYNFVP